MVVEMRFSLFGLANLQGNPFHRETEAEGYGPKVQITVWEQVEHFKQLNISSEDGDQVTGEDVAVRTVNIHIIALWQAFRINSFPQREAKSHSWGRPTFMWLYKWAGVSQDKNSLQYFTIYVMSQGQILGPHRIHQYWATSTCVQTLCQMLLKYFISLLRVVFPYIHRNLSYKPPKLGNPLCIEEILIRSIDPNSSLGSTPWPPVVISDTIW